MRRGIFQYLDKGRQRFYCGLLLFVMTAGIPMLVLPSLRNRLFSRISTLKIAMAGKTEPVSLKIGEYNEPLPVELEKTLQPRPIPSPMDVVEKVYSMTPGVYNQAPSPSRFPSKREGAKVAVPAPASIEVAESEPPSMLEPYPSEEGEIRYQTGTREREAYQILLQSIPILEGIINGDRPTISFKSWDAAFRGNEVYWVRITFQSEGNLDVEYIWEVNLETKRVRPLNFNARSLT